MVGRLGSVKHFLLSGFSNKDKSELSLKITNLGGVYHDTEVGYLIPFIQELRLSMYVTIFMSDTVDLFNFICKQRLKSALNPFLNGIENGDFDGMCKRNLRIAGRQVPIFSYFFLFFSAYSYFPIF